MKIIIGEPKEIAAYELALKDGEEMNVAVLNVNGDFDIGKFISDKNVRAVKTGECRRD